MHSIYVYRQKVIMMRRPFLFGATVLAVLIIAAFITYKYALPIYNNDSITCSSGQKKSYGCGTGLGWFLTILVVVVAVIINWLWNKFNDS
jgi:cell division protein FtsX